MKNKSDKKIPSSGIPSKYSLCIHNQKFPGDLSDDIGDYTFFKLNEILGFIFPGEYQSKLHEISQGFMTAIIEKEGGGWLSNKEIREFMEKTGYTHSTLFGSIIPKLEGFGLIERGVEEGRGKPIRVRVSPNFGELMEKLCKSWFALIVR